LIFYFFFFKKKKIKEKMSDKFENPFLVRFMTGVYTPFLLYRKESNGRITYHRYSDDRVVSQSEIPPNWFPHIRMWDNNVTLAREYKAFLKEKSKIQEHIRLLENEIGVIENLPVPPDYDNIKNALTEIIKRHTYVCTIGSSGIRKYFKKTDINATKYKMIKKSEVPSHEINSVPVKTDAMKQIEEYDEKKSKLLKLRADLNALKQKVIDLERMNPPVDNYQTILENHKRFISQLIEKHKEPFFDFNNKDKNKDGGVPKPKNSNTSNNIPPNDTDVKVSQKEINEANAVLKTFNITNKTEWKTWLNNHHCDKGGSINLTQSVVDAGRIVFGK
jgi:hypothetical protein